MEPLTCIVLVSFACTPPVYAGVELAADRGARDCEEKRIRRMHASC